MSAMHGHIEDEKLCSLPEQTSLDFRKWVLDVAAFFSQFQNKWALGKEELTRNDDVSRWLPDPEVSHFVDRLHRIREELNLKVSGLSEQEHEVARSFFRKHLLPYYLKSPFLYRAYNKPLKYAGDYMMMDMLYRENPEGETRFARAVDWYAKTEPSALAVRNRLSFLKAKLKEFVNSHHGQRVRIANIACGSAQELVDLLEDEPDIGNFIEVVLVDQDSTALSYCRNRLMPLAEASGASIEFLCIPVKDLFRSRIARQVIGKRDLVYSAGLFDYFHDKAFKYFLNSLYGCLGRDSLLVVGNVSNNNPSRIMMEYVTDWFIVHRSSNDLESFADHLQPKSSLIQVESEPLGINLFLIVRS